jgi:hypothetical protein
MPHCSRAHLSAPHSPVRVHHVLPAISTAGLLPAACRLSVGPGTPPHLLPHGTAQGPPTCSTLLHPPFKSASRRWPWVSPPRPVPPLTALRSVSSPPPLPPVQADHRGTGGFTWNQSCHCCLLPPPRWAPPSCVKHHWLNGQPSPPSPPQFVGCVRAHHRASKRRHRSQMPPP